MTSGLPAPYFKLIYRGVDISGDLDPMTTSVNYTDHLHGKASEIDVTVHDKDGRWKGSWKPEHGDTVDLTIYDGIGGILPCGVFEIDEPDADGNRDGDMLTFRGLAAPVTKPLRTKNTKAFEKQNLSAIVNEVAGKLGLPVEGQIENLFFERVTQRRERDLEFLKRLAEETGHYFGIHNNKVIFTSFKSIDGQSPALTIFHGDRALTDYHFTFKSEGTYSEGQATYLDQNKKENTKQQESDSKVTTGDTLKIAGERMESQAHAKARIGSAMHYANRLGFTGNVDMVGNTKLIAGNVAKIVGFGKYNGNRLIDSSSHGLVRGGYTSSADLVDARG